MMITLDKEANTMVVSKFSIIGKRTSSLSLDSISAVALGKEGQMHLLHIPVFKFFFKDSRTFTYDYLVDELFEASVIATFIGVPLVPDETDIRQLLATKTG
ncbi:MAG: hypothetical protein NT051_04235 [Candidatus Micrarchaeota archaeon]|nr:hypothetical protein [Candidatus Micrarchaeota archaeon]